MTIDHGSVPRSGGPLSGPRLPATGLLDRPTGAAYTRAVPSPRRHRRTTRSRLALPLALVQVDAIALCTGTGIANRVIDPTVPLAPLVGAAAVLGDEAVALLSVEPLDSTLCHVLVLLSIR